MAAVLRQARANLRGHRVQAVLIVLTLTAAAGLLTLGLAGRAVSGRGFDDLHERTRGAHLWLTLDPQRVSAAEVEAAIADLPGIDGTTGALPAAELSLPGADLNMFGGGLAVRPWAGDLPVARPAIVDGRPPASGDLGALLLDRNAAATFELAVGDSVTVPASTGPVSLRIVGLSATAEGCPFPMCTPAYGHVSHEAFDSFFAAVPVAQRRLEVGLRLEDPGAHEAARAGLDARLPTSSIRSSWDHEEMRDAVTLLFGFEAGFLTAFSVVTAVLAGFLIAVAVGGAVRAETRRVGLLKAVGFTSRQLRAVYLAEYVGLAVVAGLVGVAMAAAMAPALLHPIADQFGDPRLPSLVVPGSIGCAVTLVVAAVAVLVPVRRAVRLDVVTAIRSGAEPPPRRSARLLPLPVPVARAVADLRVSRMRSALTALGLTVLAVSLTFGMISLGNAGKFARDPEFSMYGDADIFAVQSGYLESEVVESHPDVVAVAREQRAWFNFPGETERRQIRVRAGDVDAFRYPLVEGAAPTGGDEALVGFGLSRSEGLRVGDMATIVVAGRVRDVRVSGIVRDFDNFGQKLTVTEAFLPELDRDQANVVTLVKLRAGADAETVVRELEEQADGLLRAEPVGAGILPGQFQGVQAVTRGMVVVLAVLSIIGVFNSVLLAVQERRRDIGLLKSVGMTSRQVSVSVLSGALLLAAAALVAGIPLGVAGSRVVFDQAMRSVGFGPLHPDIQFGRVLLVVPFVAAVVSLGAWLPARRAAAVPIVETLRFE